MSDDPKLTLWQKLKRLLTSAAPQSIIDAIDEPQDSSLVDSINSKSSIHPNSRAKVSLIKQPNTESTPVIDYLKRYLDNKQWHYTHYRPRKTIRKSLITSPYGCVAKSSTVVICFEYKKKTRC